MKKIFCLFGISGLIFVFLTIGLSAQIAFENQSYAYLISINNSNGSLSLDSLGLIKTNGFPDDIPGSDKDYTAKIISFGRDVLYKINFSIASSDNFLYSSSDPSWFDEQGNQIYIPTVNESDEMSVLILPTILTIPYFPNAEKIEIYSPEEELILTIDVSRYATCKTDEGCKVDYDDDLQKFIEETDKSLLEQFNKQSDKSNIFSFSGKKKIPVYFYISLAILLMAIVFTVIMIIKLFIKKKENKMQLLDKSNI